MCSTTLLQSAFKRSAVPTFSESLSPPPPSSSSSEEGKSLRLNLWRAVVGTFSHYSSVSAFKKLEMPEITPLPNEGRSPVNLGSVAQVPNWCALKFCDASFMELWNNDFNRNFYSTGKDNKGKSNSVTTPSGSKKRTRFRQIFRFLSGQKVVFQTSQNAGNFRSLVEILGCWIL